MIVDDKNIERFEEHVITTYKKAERKAPLSLKQRVLDMAQKMLDEREQQQKPLFSGRFVLMAASDGDLSIAAELTDEESGTQCRIYDPNDGMFPIEIEPLPGNEDIFNDLIGHPFVLKADEKIIYEGVLEEGEIDVFITDFNFEQAPGVWGFEVHIKAD